MSSCSSVVAFFCLAPTTQQQLNCALEVLRIAHDVRQIRGCSFLLYFVHVVVTFAHVRSRAPSLRRSRLRHSSPLFGGQHRHAGLPALLAAQPPQSDRCGVLLRLGGRRFPHWFCGRLRGRSVLNVGGGFTHNAERSLIDVFGSGHARALWHTAAYMQRAERTTARCHTSNWSTTHCPRSG